MCMRFGEKTQALDTLVCVLAAHSRVCISNGTFQWKRESVCSWLVDTYTIHTTRDTSRNNICITLNSAANVHDYTHTRYVHTPTRDTDYTTAMMTTTATGMYVCTVRVPYHRQNQQNSSRAMHNNTAKTQSWERLRRSGESKRSVFIWCSTW